MVERLLYYEHDIFLFLNSHHTPFWDAIMWLFSTKVVWAPIALFIIYVLLSKAPWRESLLILIAIVVTITLCDQFSSGLCKPYFMRLRPTHHPNFINEVQTVYGYTGGRFGFISSHAANAFGFATFMSLLFRSKYFALTIYLWALLNSYSRIYLGVHFLSDVVFGALSGLLIGSMTYWTYRNTRSWFVTQLQLKTSPHLIYSTELKRQIVLGILLSALLILLFHASLVVLIRRW